MSVFLDERQLNFWHSSHQVFFEESGKNKKWSLLFIRRYKASLSLARPVHSSGGYSAGRTATDHSYKTIEPSLPH